MLIFCIEVNNFHSFRILLQQPVWYIPHALLWCWIFCAGTLLWFYQRQVMSEKLLVMRSEKHESRRWEFTPFLGGDSHHDTAWCAFNLYQYFFVLLHQGNFPQIFLLYFSECFCNLFEICLYLEFFLPRIVTLFSTVILGDMVKVSSGFLIIVSCLSFIISSFTMMCKHKLISDAVELELPIRNKVRLVI